MLFSMCLDMLFTHSLKQFPAGVFALVTKPASQHAEDAPHAGFDIPSETAGAIEIVAGGCLNMCGHGSIGAG